RACFLYLVGERRAPRPPATSAVARRVAALDHEPLHDAVERQAVVVTVLGEQPEILDGLRRIRRQELDRDRAPVGLDHPVQAAGAFGPGWHFRVSWRLTAAGNPQGSKTREQQQSE